MVSPAFSPRREVACECSNKKDKRSFSDSPGWVIERLLRHILFVGAGVTILALGKPAPMLWGGPNSLTWRDQDERR